MQRTTQHLGRAFARSSNRQLAHRMPLLAAASAALVASGLQAGVVTPTIDIVAVSGDAAPDGNGTFSFMFAPSLNASGNAAFRATLTGTSNDPFDSEGLFLGDGTTLDSLARRDQPLPGGDGVIFTFREPAPSHVTLLNDNGQTAFIANLDDTSGGSQDDSGVFLGSPSGLVQVAREDEPAPDSNGSFSSFVGAALNDVGQVGFTAILRDTAGADLDNTGIFRGDGSGGVVQIVRDGQAAPDGNGLFDGSFFPSSINNFGQLAFAGLFRDTAGGDTDERGIFRGDGTSLVQIARAGQTTPDGNDTFDAFDRPTINDSGQVAFRGLFPGSGTAKGVYLGDGGALTTIAREGNASPDGNGTLFGFADIALNNQGQLAFTGSFEGSTGGDSDDTAMFRGDGTELIIIAREGDIAPGGNGMFARFNTVEAFPALNDAGQIAFLTSLTGTSGGTSDDQSLYFYDDSLGLLEVVREGDDFLGSTIEVIGFSGSIGALGEERSGLNEHGQVAFQFRLDDGRQGIAIWSIPEPTTLSLVGVAGLGLLRRRRA